MAQANIQKFSRFRLLKEPLSAIDQNDELKRADFPFHEELKKTKYPVRALRYWWMHCVIQDEMKRAGKPLTIVDVGCDRGIIKRFIPPVKNAKWIGLDIDTNREGIALANYDELVRCDFDEGLPLPDASADVVICSHVLEHLPRPDFTFGEISRILRPGGMLLVGFPVAPKFIATVRERQFAREIKEGKRRVGQHINVFWVNRLKKMCERNGLRIEFSTGTAMIRKKGSRLENYAFWIRLNQVWAAMFPSLGQELCVQIRKSL